MPTPHEPQAPTQRFAGEDPRTRLLSGLPVTEQRLRLARVSTAALEGGDGPPIIENARDPAIEQPAAFLEALYLALGRGGGRS
jgi:hypothetical protein